MRPVRREPAVRRTRPAARLRRPVRLERPAFERTARAEFRREGLARAEILPEFRPPVALVPDIGTVQTPAFVNPVPEAYVDYARVLTPGGGILITYKDIDDRWRHKIAKVLLWLLASGIEALFLFDHSLVHAPLDVFLWLALLVVNYLVLARPVEIPRSIEIRPDCMILDGDDLFWRSMMESWPTFEAKDGHHVLCGIYGTRLVEYTTIHRFDDMDRAPEVLIQHFQQAMQQMWMRPGM